MCTSPARVSLTLSFSEAGILSQGLYQGSRGECGNAVSRARPPRFSFHCSSGAGHRSLGDSSVHPHESSVHPHESSVHTGEELLLKELERQRALPRRKCLVQLPQRGKEGGKPPCFVLFCTCCSINDSVRRVKFALFISGITVSLPESLWLPPWVQKIFCKGQVAWLLPHGLNWNWTPWCVTAIKMVIITVGHPVPGTILCARAAIQELGT